MRRPALLTATAVASLLAAALVAQPGIANAAVSTVEATVLDSRSTWVGGDEVGTWPGTGAFPEGWSALATAPSFSADGAALVTGGLLVHPATGSAATDLRDVQSRATSTGGLDAEEFVASGDAHYALVIDRSGSAANTDPVVLTTVRTDRTAVDAGWVATEDVGYIRAGDRETLAAFGAQFATESPDATINAYGVQAVAASASVVGVTWQGETSFFTPRPTGSAEVPSPLTLSAFQTTGVRVQASGYQPGETVLVGLLLPDSEIPGADQTFVADDEGTVSGTVTGSVLPFDTRLSLLVEGAASRVGVAFPIDVVADPTAAPTPAPTTAPDPAAGQTPAPAPAPVATPVAGTATFTG